MVKVSRTIYLVAASLFLIGVALQVFLAGMVVVALEMGWSNHRDLGHGLALPLLVMLVTVYLGRMPRGTKWLTWLLFFAYALQADVLIFLRSSMPVLSAFHPVLALVDVVLGVMLVNQAWSVVRESNQTQRKLEQPDKISL